MIQSQGESLDVRFVVTRVQSSRHPLDRKSFRPGWIGLLRSKATLTEDQILVETSLEHDSLIDGLTEDVRLCEENTSVLLRARVDSAEMARSKKSPP